MAPHKCAYFRCNNKSDEKSMFRFPVNYKNRLKMWLENCGNMTLSHLPPDRLRSRFLCIEHFDKKFLKQELGKRTILRKDAIPEPYGGPKLEDNRRSPSPPFIDPELKVLPPKRVYENKRKPHEIREESANIENQLLCTIPRRRHSADMTDAEKFADVRRKWSHIRNSYSRHLRNEMHGARTGKGRMVSRWYLADELEFLREHMATDIRPTFSSYPSMVEIESLNGSDHDSKPEPGDAPFVNPWFALNQAKVEPKRETFSNDDSCSSAFDPDENSSFFQFFRGIYSDFQDLPPKKQRLFKRKCLDFLHELLDEDDVPASMVYQSDAINLTRFSRPSSEDERDQQPFCVVEKVEPCIDSPTA